MEAGTDMTAATRPVLGLEARGAPRWACRLAVLLLTIGATLAIISTYRVFSQTYDEPAHLAAGMEWLSVGRYHYEAQHPPLARVLAAVGPYLRGVRTIGKINEMYEGDLLLGQGAEYRTRLALARFGELPFFLVLAAVVWLWGKRMLGEAGGALAVLFVVCNPNILAHAGLATTDIAPTAMVTAVLYAYSRWSASGEVRDALWVGLALGVAAVSKFSTIAFLGVALPIVIGMRIWMARRTSADSSHRLPAVDGVQWTRHAAIATVVAAFIIWATYRFSFGPMAAGGVSIPAPEFFRGLKEFLGHGAGGHAAFLLGMNSNDGWWYYFPVALAVKTPIPLLLFAIIGIAAAVRAVRVSRRAFTKAFGHRTRSGFGKTAFSRIVAVWGLIWLSIRVSAPVASFVSPSRLNASTGTAPAESARDTFGSSSCARVKRTAIGSSWVMTTIPVGSAARITFPASTRRTPVTPSIGAVIRA